MTSISFRCQVVRISCFRILATFLVATIVVTHVYGGTDNNNQECGLWLGPSHWKASAEQGYGLGMYTGKAIPKGTVMGGEPLIPLHDFLMSSSSASEDMDEDDDDKHPPLREFLWQGNQWRRLVLESYHGLLVFAPGLAAIAPCTSNNFHLELVDDFDGLDSSLEFNNGKVRRRSNDPTTGSFTYYHIRMFRAVRDIQPGEELTVQCSDDDFDPTTWNLNAANNHYNPNIHFCLDDKVEMKSSTYPTIGRGVFAKQPIKANSLILSSPSVPVHRKLLDIKGTTNPERKVPHLLINYCIGHPDSDLLWLPYGPFIHSINHYLPPTTGDVTSTPPTPNVKLTWQKQAQNDDPALDQNSQLLRRQQYHHPELFNFSPERVAVTHGKGLVFDILALRDIQPGEELFLDYGPTWMDTWKKHSTRWSSLNWKKVNNNNKNGTTASPPSDYISAWEFNEEHQGPIRTSIEQHRQPYPHTITTACRFEKDWIDDEEAEDYDMIQYHSWNEQQTDHFNCLLPCMILERLEGGIDGTTETTYTAKLIDHHHENVNIEYECHIFRQFEYIYADIPRRAIEFIETAYSADNFLLHTFRHPIEPSEGMWPEQWMKKRVRRRVPETSPSADQTKEDEDPNIFKRKNVQPKVAKEDLAWKRDASPRVEL